MRLLILSLLTLMANDIFSQTNKPQSFLIVHTERHFDQSKEMYYSTIQTNSSNQSLSELLQLMPFDSKRKKTNLSVAFYKEQSDTAASIYNYFMDESEVLQFVSSKGWELFSVIGQITSDADQHLVNGQFQTYTKISTKPIYYFRKYLK